MSTRKDQLLRRAAGNNKSRAVALTREEKALRAVLEQAQQDRLAWTDDPVETVMFDRTVYGGNDWVEYDPATLPLAEGQEYTVILDNTEYKVIAQNDGYGGIFIGSESIWWGEDYVDTEPPFVFGVNNSGWCYVYPTGEHTVKVIGDVAEVHTIDPKYLPDNLPTVEQVETAQAAADNAQVAANNAQAAANNAQAAAENAIPILNATISSDTATVTNVSLVNGKIYSIIPTSTSTNGSNAYIKVGTKKYAVKTFINTSNITGYSNVGIEASAIFRENSPILVMFNGDKSVFYILSRLAHQYVETNLNTGLSLNEHEYIYAYYSSTKAKSIKYMRVKSSTEGSSKLFDIKVDDSGTITAVEVTS